MKKLTELISSLAIKAGIPADNPDLVKFLGTEAFKTLEVPEAVATPLDTMLMSESAAVNNPKVIAHIKAGALDGIDQMVLSFVTEHQLSDDAKTKITAEKSTPAKLKLMVASLREKAAAEVEEAKKAGGAGAGKDKQAEWDLIEKELRTKMATAQGEVETLKKTHADELQNLQLNYNLRNYIATKPLAFDKAMDTTLRDTMVTTAINMAFQKTGVKAVIENGQIKLRTNDGNVYYDATQKEVSYEQFVDKTLADNKMLLVSPPTPPGGGNGGNGGGGNGGNGGNVTLAPEVKNDFAEAKKQFD